MLEVTQFIFHDEATSSAAGATLYNGKGSSLTVVVNGSFEGEITPQGSLGGNWYDLMAVDLGSLDTVDKLTASGSYAIAGVDGFEKIRMNLTLTSGTVTVHGRLCY